MFKKIKLKLNKNLKIIKKIKFISIPNNKILIKLVLFNIIYIYHQYYIKIVLFFNKEILIYINNFKFIKIKNYIDKDSILIIRITESIRKKTPREFYIKLRE
jgi:hypothetical protein